MSHKVLFVSLSVLLVTILSVAIVSAQGPKPTPPKPKAPTASVGTAFTYQGQLKKSGALVNSTCDFRFGLWDDGTLGNQHGMTQTISSVSVTNGLFITPVDFGADTFTGDARWLATRVQCTGDSGYTTLDPREPLMPAPMAFSLPGFYTEQNSKGPNIIGGYDVNAVAPGVHGATIAGGGGSVDALGNGCTGCQNSVNASFATVSGGYANNIPVTGTTATIGGGSFNTASDHNATVSGGLANTANGYISTVGGGADNSASGYEATIPGGNSNTAGGTYSFAAGQRAKALDDGTFIWADSSPFDFSSSTSNTFKVRATGGIRMVVQIDGSGNPTVSCLLNDSTVSWSCSSDRNVKENFITVDSRAVLDKLSALPILEWNIIGADPNIKHIGPTAQDFYEAFGLGNDATTIGTVDAQGVALVAIQGLYQVVREKDAKIATQQKQIDDLEMRITALEHTEPTGTSAIPSFDSNAFGFGAMLLSAFALYRTQRRTK